MSKDLLFIRSIRGELTESMHTGHMVITNSQGTIIAQLGNPQYLTYARSTAKPLQALAIIEAGAVDQYNLSPADIAIICASHNGEQPHADQVLSILNKIGMTAVDLRCGIHDNCSGKHAGMLVLSRMLGIDALRYDELKHPVQLRIAQTIASVCDIDSLQLITAVDGCGVPVFGMPIHRLALGFARLGTPPPSFHNDRKNACHTIINALRHSPFLLAGTDRFDTDLIHITNGRIIGKMGAEGIYAFTIPGQDIGAAIKIVDGAERALYPAVVEILHQLKLLQENELMKLGPYHKPDLVNRHGEIVGSIQPHCQLHKNE
ncbi:MAG: asparaginase [Paenibacillaceae bacterium]